MNDFTLPLPVALPETSCLAAVTMLVAWGARALYVGPSLRLAAHGNAVAVLAVALDGQLEVAHFPEQPELGFRTCRTVLIEPAQLHLIRSTGRNCAFLYLDALSDDLQRLRLACRERGERACFQLSTDEVLIGVMGSMARSGDGWEASRPALVAALGAARARPDRRMQAAIDALTRAPEQVTHVAALALAAGLSASRFQLLFKRATGVPFRRFRNWTRLRAALAAAQRGASLTAAAHAAGFASSAHLSTAFKDMFGMTPSQLLAAQLVLLESATGSILR